MGSSRPFPRTPPPNEDPIGAARAVHDPPPDSAEVPEALVQDLWAHQRFASDDLATTDDAAVTVFDPGTPNTDAGPDFRNAHVRIGDIDWRGDVEIHNASGGWFEHEHHTDPRYDSVVLHVTLHPDVWTGGLLRADESPLPEIVLYPRLETSLRELLHSFRTRGDDDTLPCTPRWADVPDDLRWDWIHRLARDRLNRKRDQLPASGEGSLASALHERLFAGLGYAKNDASMSTLAERVPPVMLRDIEEPRTREALLLGAAGLIPEPGDLLDTDRETADYAMDLRDRFRRLRVRRDVSPMASTAWTFFRLRPNNFPPLRIAQAAAWYADDGLMVDDPLPRLRNTISQEDAVPAFREALSATPSDFWHTHYHLTNTAAEHDPSLGPSRIDTLLINAVAPALLRDAEQRNDAALRQAVIELLRTLPASGDRVVRRFKDLGTDPNSAFDAQGLHELYRHYCSDGGCLDCKIGQFLLNR
ncbi:MAG: DUF2851 family protein [Salinibacter sp.]